MNMEKKRDYGKNILQNIKSPNYFSFDKDSSELTWNKIADSNSLER